MQGQHPLTLRLFHGRPTPETELEDWGSDGPIFAIDSIHFTYQTLRVSINENLYELAICEDMIRFDGVFYGDFEVGTLVEPTIDSTEAMRILEYADIPNLMRQWYGLDPNDYEITVQPGETAREACERYATKHDLDRMGQIPYSR